FDIRAFGDDLIKPALIEIVTKDAGVDLTGLGVGDAVEVNAVQVLKGGKLIAIEAGGARVVKIVLCLGPPILEFAPGLPRRQFMIPRVVAVSPKAIQVHSFAVFRFEIAGQFVERPEMVVCINGRHTVEVLLDVAVGLSLTGGVSYNMPGIHP